MLRMIMNHLCLVSRMSIVSVGILSGCAVPPPPSPEPPTPTVIEPTTSPTPNGRWLLVDTRTKVLKVMQDDQPIQTFSNVALGSRGAGIKQRRGDSTTPIGTFRIGWVNEKSRFRRFFGLDYPNLDYAERGYRQGLIDEYTYLRIKEDLIAGRTPPQNTPLGGQIGIHGIGAGDPKIHANFNWTEGCVALDNQQIDLLTPWIQIGMLVEIR